MYPNTTIPAPTDFYFKSWGEDPLFRGSYANWPPSFLEEKHANLRADVRRRVWFAGEAGSKLYFGAFWLSTFCLLLMTGFDGFWLV